MTLDPSRALMQLSPVQPTNLNFGNDGQAAQLRLMREQFEFQKKKAEEDMAYKKQADEAEAARAALQAEAAKKKALEDNRNAIQEKFQTSAAAGNPEGAEAMMPLMQDLGMGVDILKSGGPGQMPVYRLHHDLAKDQATELADANTKWEASRNPIDRPIYADPYGEGGGAEPANPTIAPTTPTGNVLDLQRMQEQRAERLGPAMQQLNAAYPTDYQGSAANTSGAILSSGVPADKALEEYRAQRSGPDAMYRAQLEADAKKATLDTKNDITEPQKTVMRKAGLSYAEKIAGSQNIKGAVSTIDLAQRVEDALSSDDPYIQAQAAQYLLKLGKVTGSASDKDLGLALGDQKAATLDQVANYIETHVYGGFPTKQREGLIKWARMQRDKEQSNVNNFLDSLDREAGARSNEYEKEGIVSYRNSLPEPQLRAYEAWKAERDAKEEKSGRSPTASVGKRGRVNRGELTDEIMVQAAERGLDPEPMLAIMGGESSGDTNAASSRSSAKGLFQFTDETAQRFGLKDAAEYAALPADKQIDLALQYFEKSGITPDSPPEDYAVAIAAPAHVGEGDDAVAYRKGSAQWLANPGWRPADGGDITNGSIIAYYRKHGLGKKSEPKAAELTPIATEPPEPKNDAEKKLRDALLKGR